jgi:hypothetical protein
MKRISKIIYSYNECWSSNYNDSRKYPSELTASKGYCFCSSCFANWEDSSWDWDFSII